MTPQERKDKALLHKQITDAICDNAENDNIYLKRMMWAFEIISNMIVNCSNDLTFKEEEEMEE